jgi:agmatinase
MLPDLGPVTDPGVSSIGDGLVDPARSVQVGMRTPNPDTCGFTIVEADPLLAQPMTATVERIRGIVGDDPVYLTFDIDFLDPGYAPGTGTPVCGGPTTHQARQLLHGLAGGTFAYDLLSLLARARQRR